MRCLSEAVTNLWEAMSVVCTLCMLNGAIYFYLFPKIEWGMAAVSSMVPPLRLYRPMLRTVILVLAINSLKMKQMFFLFVLQ